MGNGWPSADGIIPCGCGKPFLENVSESKVPPLMAGWRSSQMVVTNLEVTSQVRFGIRQAFVASNPANSTACSQTFASTRTKLLSLPRIGKGKHCDLANYFA